MDLTLYVGKYLKVNTRDQEWFVGELLKATPAEYEFNILSSSKDQRSRMERIDRRDQDRKRHTGIRLIRADEIMDIEELGPKVQQGIRLTLANAPSIKEAYLTMKNENLPNRVEFGRMDKEKD